MELTKVALVKYLLQWADNGLILGHKLSEWCGHGPVLEQDIAMTNMSLDHLGQARNFYQYAASIFNDLTKEGKNNLFVSDAISKKINEGINIDEDDLAFLRDAWDFRNVLLTELPNGDFAHTIVRSFFYDHFTVLHFTSLLQSEDSNVRAIAEKSLKEALYHRKWSSEWVIRLGDGTDISKEKISNAIDEIWPYTGELFKDSSVDIVMHDEIKAPLCSSLKDEWTQNVMNILEEATIPTPNPDIWMHTGGKEGTHTEHLGFALAEMQFMQRAYPNMEW